MEIVIKVSAKQLRFVATDIVNNIFDEYGADVCNFAGVYCNELIEGVMESYEFSKHVEKKVLMHGPDFLDCPYDYDNYMEALLPLEKHVGVFHNIWAEADTVEYSSADQNLLAALKLVREAGFKVI